MRRLTALLLATGLLLVGSAAIADEHPPAFPEHAHLLLIDFEVDESGSFPLLLSVRKCVDVANNRALRLNAHHAHVHVGMGNFGLEHGDNVLIPAHPFPIGPDMTIPWRNCAELLEFYGLD